MFDKFTLYIHSKAFEQAIIHPKVLGNKTWLKIYPQQYFPRIEYCPQYYTGPSFKIEFSAPKLLYGNNLLEVQESDFNTVIESLLQQLGKIGFKISKNALVQNSTIQNVEISKNILLGGVPTLVVLEHLRKAKPPRPQMFLTEKDWTTGKQVTFKGIKHEITFYDKYPELVKEYGHRQFNLDEFFRWNKYKNILRMEIRLQKQQIAALAGKTLTLEELFKEKWAYKAFTKYWKPLFEHVQHTQPYLMPEAELLLYTKQGMDPNKIKDLHMAKHFINQYGYVEAKRQLELLLGEKEAKKMMQQLDKQPEMTVILPTYNFIPIIDKAIKSHNWLTPERLATLEEPKIAYEPYLHKLEWDTTESSKYLGIGVREIQKRCKKGLLPYRLEAGSYRLRAADVICAKYNEQNC